ncbi:hypothetical protein ANANG_G00315210 [Anguilla anguilla]|uniref:acetate--CoA ligase n=1 Tax=Anguilla anguilla TaxID=7936 RepID=A0A9D3RI32_ANGAN|nr:hypothetical protein ANANG_G00315210 [Anguilla anguilla]
MCLLQVCSRTLRTLWRALSGWSETALRVLFVGSLPKTRSGKIPRSTLSDLVNRKPYKITPTIEDAEVFKAIEKTVRERL